MKQISKLMLAAVASVALAAPAFAGTSVHPGRLLLLLSRQQLPRQRVTL